MELAKRRVGPSGAAAPAARRNVSSRLGTVNALVAINYAPPQIYSSAPMRSNMATIPCAPFSATARATGPQAPSRVPLGTVLL